jgi:hypothetical protein
MSASAAEVVSGGKPLQLGIDEVHIGFDDLRCDAHDEGCIALTSTADEAGGSKHSSFFPASLGHTEERFWEKLDATFEVVDQQGAVELKEVGFHAERQRIQEVLEFGNNRLEYPTRIEFRDIAFVLGHVSIFEHPCKRRVTRASCHTSHPSQGSVLRPSEVENHIGLSERGRTS